MRCSSLALALVIASGCGADGRRADERIPREATPPRADGTRTGAGVARGDPVVEVASAPPPSQVVPTCEPTSTPVATRYDELRPDPAVLWLVDVRFDPAAADWMPVSQLAMPMHHASRIRWIDEPPHDELVGARERVLRIAFVVVDRQLVRSIHEGVQIDATYTLDVVAVCEPRDPT